MVHLRVVLPVLLLAFLLVGCNRNLPHTNPLDPLSEAEDLGSLQGRVVLMTSPGTPVTGALVVLRADSTGPAARPRFETLTDNQGQYAFRNIPVGSYTVEIRKEGFSSTGNKAEVQLGRTGTVEPAMLNGLPSVTVQNVYSTHEDLSWVAADIYRVRGLVTVEDPDGPSDIALVWLEAPDLAFRDTLDQKNGSPGQYELMVDAENLPSKNLHDLAGRWMVVKAQDASGAVASSAPFVVKRVIEDVPQLERPVDAAIVSTRYPTLYWERFILPYTYRLQVSLCEFVDPNVDCRPVKTIPAEVPPRQDSLYVEFSLKPGVYIWSVTAIDEYGNRSRSKEARFRVQ